MKLAIVPAARVLPPPMYASLIRAMECNSSLRNDLLMQLWMWMPTEALARCRRCPRHRENSVSNGRCPGSCGRETARDRQAWHAGSADENGSQLVA
jgi:hypothetical protein